MEIEGYHMPDDLYDEENHYWVKKDGDTLIMGMDDFAQKMAGENVYVQLPFEGKTLKQGKKFAQVESGKWLGKVYAPVDGELIESNEELEGDPTIINEDCYGEGWMYRIQPADMAKIDEVLATNADTIVTACQQCVRTMTTYVRRNKIKLKVLDLAQLVQRALVKGQK